jgi:hypothetical protein
LICRLMLDYRQIVVRQIAGNLPWFSMVDHICKCRSGGIQRRREPPPKTGHDLRSFARPNLTEGHEAILYCRPKVWCDRCHLLIYMILLRGQAFNTLSAEAI